MKLTVNSTVGKHIDYIWCLDVLDWVVSGFKKIRGFEKVLENIENICKLRSTKSFKFLIQNIQKIFKKKTLLESEVGNLQKNFLISS